MDSSEEKYLKLLAKYEKLEEEYSCRNKLQECNNAYMMAHQTRRDLISSIAKLYSSWLPPKIYSFISTMKAWVKTGFKKSKYKDRRLAICNDCEHFKNQSMCTLCGCYMKAKAGLAGASCPALKWKSED